jgi:hypothetical protein
MSSCGRETEVHRQRLDHPNSSRTDPPKRGQMGAMRPRTCSHFCWQILLCAFFVLSVFVQAEAQPAESGQVAPPVAPLDFTIRANLGLVSELLGRTGDGFGFLLEPQGSVRYKFLTVGIGLRGGIYGRMATPFGSFLLGGFAFPLEHGRLELVGTTGINAFRNVGRETSFWGDQLDPGIDVTLPFAGARLGGSALIGRGRWRATLGGSLAFERDLREGSRTYQYTHIDTGWIGEDESEVRTARQQYGWTRVGFFLHGGVSWFPRR